ncbi:MAG: cold-inducible RNA-binding protein [Chlamydiales bacterium]|jgi:cold-inducible RNA-binding protein
MANTLFVGNLPFKVDEATLEAFFRELGEVNSVRIITDPSTGRSRGFGFVELTSDDEAETDLVVKEADGKDFQGRALKVGKARSKD